MRERGLERLYDEIELPLSTVLAAMEDAGVRIDTYRMGEITARLSDRVEELEARAYELAGEEFVIGSPVQLGRILFEKLELTPGRKGKTGYSTDGKVLRAIRADHEIVPVVEEWRELTKLVNTYLGPLPTLIGEDGRLHTTINQHVAATGRLSTSSPNLQAIPIRTELGREIRSAFVAEPGHRLLSADYSQIELRILAHVSGEPKLREAFLRGEDIHTATAAEVLGKDPATLTKDERNVAKMINFGIVYGISAFGLSENLDIPKEQAQAYIDAYLARFPQVQAFIARTITQAGEDGYATSLLGRRRPVPELRASNRQTRGFGERVAVNFVMQGSNADIIKVAMVAIHGRLRAEGRGARLVLQVHDELLLEVPETEVTAVRELVREEMVGAYPLDPPLAVDVGVGDDWAEAKSLDKNARAGLKTACNLAILRDPMANDTVEKPAAVEEGVWITGPDGELVPDYESSFPEINEGEVVHGTVVRVDKDEVLVDIGYKSEGVIPVAELTIRRSVNPADEVALGEEIDALVLTKEDAEGRLILSKKRARFELAWKKIEAAAESGEAVVGKVIEVVKGGLILDLGVRGFLPASLVDIRRVQDLDEFMARELRCKVIELNRSRNNVVLSRRAVLEDERKEMRQAILDRLSPGDVIEGQISNIVDFGAFVDLDGMDGLIHISELSWSHVNHPSEVLDIGQTVQVKVLDIDRDRQRISLGLKQTQSDPWQQVLDSYREDDVVEGRVAKVVTFGAFVEILPGVEGLVHISELAAHHVENPREVVAQGQAVNVRILEIDGDRRRLSLSLKRVEEGDQPVPRADGAESVHETPNLVLSEEAFPAGGATAVADEEGDTAETAKSDGGEEAGIEIASEASPSPSSGPSRSSSPRSGSSPRPSRDRARSSRGRPSTVEVEAARGVSGRAPWPRTTTSPSATRPERPAPNPLQRPLAVAITGGIGAGKELRSRASAGTARRPSRATRSSITSSPPTQRSSARSSSGSATRSSVRTEPPIASGSRCVCSRIETRSTFWRSCSTRSCRANTSLGASSSPRCPLPRASA